MPKIAIGAEILNNVTSALQKEYLTTNGLGGYASSTVAGCNTRRYHGLLVGSRPGDKGRTVLLSKLEESLKIGHRYYYLSTNKYTENYTHPRGYIHMRKFQQAPFPRFIYTIGDVVVEKEIFMPYNRLATVVRYRLFGGGSNRFSFFVHPLTSFKDFHALQKENQSFETSCTFQDETLSMKPYQDLPRLNIKAPGMQFKELKNWYKNFYYEREKDRGLDFIGDLFNPGYFFTPEVDHFTLDIVITTDDEPAIDVEKEYESALERVNNLFDLAEADPGDPDEKSLVLAADMHCVKNRDDGEKPRSTIVAGYHWFGDWGRDTFISLPGITLATGRFDEARDVLRNFAAHQVDGIIPNRFGDLGKEPSYNTVDASLWFINSVHLFLEATGDFDFVKEHLWGTLTTIISHYKGGTRYGIEMDEDGLVTAGIDGMQLTWMDARVDNWVVTPRIGKAVEINALWYNALRIMEKLSKKFHLEEQQEEYAGMAQKTRFSFNEKFWYSREGYLYDYIGSNGPDKAFRPNQLFAVSLPYPVLNQEYHQSVVSLVFKRLYTPTGMRSLDPENPLYRGFYSGGPRERDSSYHMGVAWGWLLGPFIEAYLKTHENSKDAVKRARIMMDLWMGDLLNGGLNTLSEIFDGDEPFSCRGCISQAWTVAEALRIKKLLKKLDV